MSLSEKREHILEGTSAGMAIYFEDKVREAVLRLKDVVDIREWKAIRQIFGEKLT